MALSLPLVCVYSVEIDRLFPYPNHTLSIPCTHKRIIILFRTTLYSIIGHTSAKWECRKFERKRERGGGSNDTDQV